MTVQAKVIHGESTHGPPPRRYRLVGVICAATAILLAMANLIDVYGDSLRWALTAVPAVASGAAIAWSGTWPAWRLWRQLASLAAVQFVLGPLIAVDRAAVSQPPPIWRTLVQGWEATFGAFKHLIAVEPPIGTAHGSLMAIWTIGVWFALLAGVFAVCEHAWLTVMSVLPIGAAMALCAWLGTDSGWHRAGVGVLVGSVLIVWLSWRWGSFAWKRWRTVAAMLAVAVAVAGFASFTLPQHRRVLRNIYDPPFVPVAYASPLSGFRSYIKDHRDETLLTVEGLPEGTPVRLAVMDHFDGTVWNLAGTGQSVDSAPSSGSSQYRRVGARIHNETQGESFTATFTVASGLTDIWLPLAGAATSVDFADDEDARAFFYNTDTDSGILSHATTEGMAYTETGVIAAVPNNDAIDQATAAHTDQPQALDIPEVASEFASVVAGGRASDGEAARAMATLLRTSGWFSHGLEGDYPSLAGHGNYRITSLLSGDAMVGDDEQYASAMALMARTLGLSSRVALGFRSNSDSAPSNPSVPRNASDSSDSSSSVVSFTGGDITAWTEINLSGLGWVAFHPTPDETKTPNDDQSLTPPDPQTLVRQPPVPLTDPLRETPRIQPHSAITGTDAERNENNPFRARFVRLVTGIALYGAPLWIAVILIGGILALNAVRRMLSRIRGTPRQRILAGWNTLCDLAESGGIPLSGSRRQQASDITNRMLLDDHTALTVRSLGYAADFAAFSGQAIHTKQARRYWRHVNRLRTAMLRALPRTRRWRARLALRGTRSRRRSSVHDSLRIRAGPRHPWGCRGPATSVSGASLTERRPDRRRGRPDRRRR
ncbi:transglutaminase-like domain-containing protein [Bifidobacterium eulemuris]|uniref:Transglutaminase n=1 Tax=Bifidobacterium eulemuris TaxID=1765219 RepID=A0A261GBR9_9BIFI|nr:transglutaminase-like domain-containing protein [Bifidobacterium eulemuris]OZG68615.1 transglutaminase [Bifidobacterium eulemuris]QOL32736.1 transglutaminase domain-containing protein [Bifidobacterium eulemuris]